MTATTTEPRLATEYTSRDLSADFRKAVARKFYEVPGRMDIRRLWHRDGVEFYRVNWWKLRPNMFEQYIWRSAFVVVEMTPTGFLVHENASAQAA